ncbi:Leucine-rich repeat [Sesbania bispinosa]|nr:Leucine-rich repeat [Sesbania bispinosa]
MESCSMLEKKEAEGVSTIIIGPNWLELPRDVTVNILQRLGVVEIVTRACQVCPLWWNICKDPLMWRTIHMISNRDTASRFDLVKICRYAVQQSCGHVEDISIENFGTNDLLKYIAQSTSHLRRLRLGRCTAISGNGFSVEVVKKLSLLEELDISSTNLSVFSLAAIGRYCPVLKVLKISYSKKARKGNVKCDDDVAFAIARWMPKLRHLHLLGNKITNDGLLAILDGCPLLETLDLRKCFCVDLSGSLGKRCNQKIKNLLSPNDYVDSGNFGDDFSHLDVSSDSSSDDGYSYWDYVADYDYDDYREEGVRFGMRPSLQWHLSISTD